MTIDDEVDAITFNSDVGLFGPFRLSSFPFCHRKHTAFAPFKHKINIERGSIFLNKFRAANAICNRLCRLREFGLSIALMRLLQPRFAVTLN